MKSVTWMIPIVVVIVLLSACQPIMPPASVAESDAGMKAGAAQVEVFAQGAALPGIMDVDVAPDGTIYVAAEMARSIIGVDPTTGDIVQQIDVGEDIPMALRVAPDGTVYWTSFYSLNICMQPPRGVKSCLPMPVDTWGLSFAPDGRLFVSADAHVQSLYEVDPMLQEAPKFIETVGALMGHYNFGPDEKLYVPMVGDGTILRIDVDTDPITIETIAEGLVFPWSVAFDGAGELYVAVNVDGETSAILRVDPATGETETVGLAPAGYITVAVTDDDRIIAAVYDEGALYEITADGTTQALTTPGMIAPGGLAVLPNADGGETLYVADWKTLRGLDTATGDQHSAWHSTWFPGSIISPRTVASDGENLVLAAWYDQWGGNTAMVWDPNAGAANAAEAEFTWPMNAIGFQDDIVVVDIPVEGAWTVERTNGAALAERHQLGEGALQKPLGLAASEDNLWVTDYETGNVLQLVANGEELAQPVVVAEALDRPEGIAVAPDGRLLVVETGTGRLLAIDPSTGAVSVVADGLGISADNFGSIGPVGLPPHLVFNGVAVGPSGDVYVSGDAENVVYRIQH